MFDKVTRIISAGININILVLKTNLKLDMKFLFDFGLCAKISKQIDFHYFNILKIKPFQTIEIEMKSNLLLRLR